MSRHRARREPFVPPAQDEGYRGRALLVVGGTELEVEVDLLDHFEPLDGRTHWYGRIQAASGVDALKQGGATSGELRIGALAAPVRLAEHDPWGNVAVTGVGAPPYGEDDPVILPG